MFQGVWLFKGPLKTNSAMMHYGDSFGDERLQTSFPVSVTPVRGNYCWKNNMQQQHTQQRSMGMLTTQDSSSIARINTHGEIYTGARSLERYTCVDESFMSGLQASHWKRDNGITELIPIAVVHQI
jgi:hypothetical protein